MRRQNNIKMKFVGKKRLSHCLLQ